MSAPEEPEFIDDDELIDPGQALCVLREHLSETLDLSDIAELLKG